MKTLKRLHYKITILLIAIGSMVFLYWYANTKSFEPNCIPKDADAVVMVDVKNIRNYSVISLLKNPSEWQWNKPKTKLEKLFSFTQYGLEKPDYLAFFHIEKQTWQQWFLSLKIDNEAAFEKAIKESHFSQMVFPNHLIIYSSEKKGISIIKHFDQILVSNLTEKQKITALKVARNFLVEKHFLDSKKILKTINTDNEVIFWIKKNNFLEKDGILNLKLKEKEITIDGKLQMRPKFDKKWAFSQNPNALLSLGFNFEIIQELNSIKNNSAKINKLLGFDIDSVCIHNPTKTELSLNDIIEKKQISISYDYDDDFNRIKKEIVNTTREPSFRFSIQTENTQHLYQYLKSQNAIDSNSIFVNFPLAKTKSFLQKNTLLLEANLSKKEQPKSAPKIGFLKINFGKLKPKDWQYLTAKNEKIGFLKPFETLEIDLTQQNFRASLKTKNNKSLLSIK